MQTESTDFQNEKFAKQVNESKIMGSLWESYAIDLNNQNSTDKTSFNFYSEYFLMAAILEAFMSKEKLTLKELNSLTSNYVPESLIWTVTVPTYHSAIIKMIRLGYIETIRNEEATLPIFQITALGIKTLQEQTFQNLASTSFFNHQSYNFNKKSFLINLFAILMAVLSLIVAIIALVI